MNSAFQAYETTVDKYWLTAKTDTNHTTVPTCARNKYCQKWWSLSNENTSTGADLYRKVILTLTLTQRILQDNPIDKSQLYTWSSENTFIYMELAH